MVTDNKGNAWLRVRNGALLSLWSKKTGVRLWLVSLALAMVFGIISATLMSITGVEKLTPKAHAASTSSTLNFQARLLTPSGSLVPDGYYNIRFKLYDGGTQGGPAGQGQANAGTQLWSEEHKDTNGASPGQDYRVRVVNGYFSVYLGSQTAFPSINWDQELWLTMDIGGTTQTATPTYDGEMLSTSPAPNSRIKLSAVPYAFKAGQLAQHNTGTGFTSILSLLQPTVGNQTFQIADQGAAGTYTLCIQGSTSCGFAPTTGGTGYIQNGTSLQASSNFYISGDGRAGTSFTTPLLQAPAGSALTVTANASSVWSTTAGNLTVRSDAGNINLHTSGTGNTGVVVKPTTANSTGAFQVQNQAGTALLNADTTNMRVSVGSIGTATGQLYVSGKLGTSVATASMGHGGMDPYRIAVQGRYAYVVDFTFGYNVLKIFDVTNPANPINTGNISISGSTVNRGDIVVVGRFAYVVSGSSPLYYLQIFDVTNPANPTSIASSSLSGRPTSIKVQGRYAYVVSGTSSPYNLQIFDIGSPSSGISLAGSVSTGLIPTSVAVQGRYAYVTNQNSNTLQIFDVSNPSSPSSVGSVNTGNSPQSVAVQGRYAYVGGNSPLTVVDISNPALPTVATTVAYSASSVMQIQSNYLYVGTQIFNISNPASIAYVGGWTAPGGYSSDNIAVQGRYSYSVAGNALQVADLGGAYIQQLEVGGTETGTLSVQSAGSIGGNLSVQGGLTVVGASQLSGNVGLGGQLDITGSLATKRGTDYSTTGTSNNVNFGEVSLVRLTGASAQTITGIANGRDGEILTIVNAANQSATISNNSGSSTATNRIITGTGADITLNAGASITLIYDAGASLWRTTGSVAFSTGNFIQNGTSPQANANFNIQSSADASVTGVLTARASQTADLLQARNSSGTKLSGISADGSLTANATATGTTATTSGTGTNTTTVTLTAGAFANGDVIFIDNAGQDYYTRIISGGGTATLTVSPAVTFENSRTVTKYNIQNIGATSGDYTTQGNRFFQGYFLGGVVTGAGSTTLSDGRLHSTTPMNFNSPSYTFQNTSNSTNAFRVQDAGGADILNISTTDRQLIVTGGFQSSFVKTWGGTGDDQGRSTKQTSDGGYIVTGRTTSYGAGSGDVFISKYDSAGNLSWNRTWGGTGDDQGHYAQQTSDGGYVVVGSTASYGAGNYDSLLIKYDSAGNLSWNRTWGGTGDDRGYSVAQTSDGGYIVTGQTYVYGTSMDMFLAKYDSAGNLSWNRTWGSNSGPGWWDYGNSVIQTSDGGYAVGGATTVNITGDAFIAKYDSAGNLSWVRTWQGNIDDRIVEIQQVSDGYIATGWTNSYGAGSEDMLLIKYDSAGNLSWNKTWGGTGSDTGSSTRQTSDGGYIVAGNTASYGAGSNDVFIAKYDSAGNLSWNKTWGGTGSDTGSSTRQTSDGGYIVAGNTASYGAGSNDVFIAKYDSAGNIFGCTTSCGAPTATVNTPTAIINSPVATIGTPTATVNTPTATVNTPTATINTPQAGHIYVEVLKVTGDTLLDGQLTMGANQNIKAQGSVYLQNATDSTNAFSVHNAGGSNLLVADTSNMNFKVSGSAVFQNQTNSTNAFQIQNSSGINLFSMDSTTGTAIFRSTQPVAKSFVVQANVGYDILSVNSDMDNVQIDNGWLTINGVAPPTNVTLSLVGTGGTLTNARYHWYKVLSKNAANVASNAVSPTTPASGYVLTANGTSRVDLSWNATTDAYGYYIVRAVTTTPYVTDTDWDEYYDITTNPGGVVNFSDTSNALWTGGNFSGYIRQNYSSSVDLAIGGKVDFDKDNSDNTMIFKNANIGTLELYNWDKGIRLSGYSTGVLPTTDSVNTFYIQKNSGDLLFNADATNSRISIGNPIADSTGIVLVLDNKNTAGDPTGVDGAMYYNSSTKAFRCYSNGAWRSCVAGVVAVNTTVPAGNTVASTTTETNFATNYTIPANDCQPGRVYRITAHGVWGTGAAVPTLNMRIKLGNTVIGTTGAVSLTNMAQTDRTWRIDYSLVCQTAGVSGTAEGQGIFTRFYTNEQTSQLWGMTTTAPTTINTTTSQTLQISAQFNQNAPGHTITARQIIVEASGP